MRHNTSKQCAPQHLKTKLNCTYTFEDRPRGPRSGGLIFNSKDISALIAAVGSGLPGEYALRLEGEGPFEIPYLNIHPFQEVHIICAGVGSLVLMSAVSTFVTLAANVALVISG